MRVMMLWEIARMVLIQVILFGIRKTVIAGLMKNINAVVVKHIRVLKRITNKNDLPK